MRVQIVYFAAARELAECASEEQAFAHQVLTIDALLSALGERKPRLAPYLARMRCALNGEFASREANVYDGDELTVLPPVAGGSALAEVRAAPLSIDEVVACVRHPSAGAIAIFLGVVRDHHAGAAVARLDYEAHPVLAPRELERIVDAAMRENEGCRVAALHRVGELAVGELAVVVAVSSAHRDAAFRVCRETIDAIKASAPIWKKEWGVDGGSVWVNLEADERK